MLLAGVVKSADTQDLGSCALGRVGSSPTFRTRSAFHRPEPPTDMTDGITRADMHSRRSHPLARPRRDHRLRRARGRCWWCASSCSPRRGCSSGSCCPATRSSSSRGCCRTRPTTPRTASSASTCGSSRSHRPLRFRRRRGRLPHRPQGRARRSSNARSPASSARRTSSARTRSSSASAALTVILARFVPIVRTFAPVAAGVGHMPWRKYSLYNLIGADPLGLRPDDVRLPDRLHPAGRATSSRATST